MRNAPLTSIAAGQGTSGAQHDTITSFCMTSSQQTALPSLQHEEGR